MNEKVKISCEQEKLLNQRISHYKRQQLNKNQIVSSIFDDKKSRGFFEGTSFHNMGTFDFMKILTGQYEVEQTPEDKIKDLFYGYAGENEFYESDAQKAIQELLEILGKKVKGVNT